MSSTSPWTALKVNTHTRIHASKQNKASIATGTACIAARYRYACNAWVLHGGGALQIAMAIRHAGAPRWRNAFERNGGGRDAAAAAAADDDDDDDDDASATIAIDTALRWSAHCARTADAFARPRETCAAALSQRGSIGAPVGAAFMSVVRA